MEKRNITLKEAEDVWRELGNNDYVKTMFPTLRDYWEDCQRINNLPEKEWQDLVEKNQKKLKKLTQANSN